MNILKLAFVSMMIFPAAHANGSGAIAHDADGKVVREEFTLEDSFYQHKREEERRRSFEDAEQAGDEEDYKASPRATDHCVGVSVTANGVTTCKPREKHTELRQDLDAPDAVRHVRVVYPSPYEDTAASR